MAQEEPLIRYDDTDKILSLPKMDEDDRMTTEREQYRYNGDFFVPVSEYGGGGCKTRQTVLNKYLYSIAYKQSVS